MYAIRSYYAGDRPIQVGSHYHFFETNEALSFDRGRSYGCSDGVPVASNGGSPPV